MWRDYIQPIATITALVLSTAALVVAQFPIEATRTKWSYIICVAVLNVVAAGSVIYGTYHTIDKAAQEKTRRAEIREQLGIFIDQGSNRMRRIADSNQPNPTSDANQWGTLVETFLVAMLGQSYVVRFRSEAGIVAGQPPLEQGRLEYWLGVRNRVIRLQQFSAELP